jgi:membrane protein YdbS with pleckstrin-like domain
MLSTYRLPNSIPDEKIVKIVRKDIFILFKKFLFSLLIMVLPLLFFAMVLMIYPDMIGGEVSNAAMILAVSGYYLFAWLFAFFLFIDYYLDVWIITSERIIDIQQNGFFSRTIAEQRLSRVQDVTSEVKGAMATILRFGDVYVQTAGETQRFNFYSVPRPDLIRDLIIKLSERKRAHAG